MSASIPDGFDIGRAARPHLHSRAAGKRGAMAPPTAAGSGAYTHLALVAKRAEKAAHEIQLAKAVALIEGGAHGAARAVSHLVEGCSFQQIGRAVERSSAAKPSRARWEILTPIENERLVAWITSSARNDSPCTESQVSEKVTQMLQCRLLFNRQNHTGKAAAARIPLSKAEERIALQGGVLSHMWFAGFHASNPSCSSARLCNLLLVNASCSAAKERCA